jgi:DNA replication protein DnaC
MKLAYIRKKINGIVIDYEFAIPLNHFFNELKSLNDEKFDTLIKTYDQLQLIMIDDVF